MLRPYNAQTVASLQNTYTREFASDYMAKKLWKLLSGLKVSKSYSATFGALDPIMAVNLAKYMTTIYISGW